MESKKLIVSTIKINSFDHKKLIGNISIISAVMETKLNLPKAFLHWSQKNITQIWTCYLKPLDNVKWKNFFEKTPPFLLNKVHSVHSINFLKGI